MNRSERDWLSVQSLLEYHVLRRSAPHDSQQCSQKDLEAWASLKIQTVIRHLKVGGSCDFIYLDGIKRQLMA